MRIIPVLSKVHPEELDHSLLELAVVDSDSSAPGPNRL